jgi:hypothetical protein
MKRPSLTVCPSRNTGFDDDFGRQAPFLNIFAVRRCYERKYSEMGPILDESRILGPVFAGRRLEHSPLRRHEQDEGGCPRGAADAPRTLQHKLGRFQSANEISRVIHSSKCRHRSRIGTRPIRFAISSPATGFL